MRGTVRRRNQMECKIMVVCSIGKTDTKKDPMSDTIGLKTTNPFKSSFRSNSTKIKIRKY